MKYNKVALLLALMFYIIPVIASAQQLKTIDKGEAAPYKGFVIDAPMEKKMRQNAKDLSILRLQKSKYEALNEVQEYRIGIYREDLKTAQKGLRKAQMRATFGTVMGFTIGVGLSALASYAILRTLK